MTTMLLQLTSVTQSFGAMRMALSVSFILRVGDRSQRSWQAFAGGGADWIHRATAGFVALLSD